MGVIAAAAHELKSPLTLINHIAHTLDDAELILSDDERTQQVKRLQLTTARMLRLVQQLTVSYRLDEAMQLAFTFELEPLNLHEVCETVLHEMTPLASAYNQKLKLARRSKPQLVLANRDILHDIVGNLVDNAVRHNPVGQQVQLYSKTNGDRARVYVQDQGLGIGARELAMLDTQIGTRPQPFTGQAGSSGLGLYIAQHFAFAMGGRLGVGRAEKGSLFFVDMLKSHQLSLF